MTGNTALIIDDEPDIQELLEITLNRMNIECSCASDIKTAKALLKQRDFNICLTDMRLPDGDGLEFITYLQKKYPKVPVAMITAHGNIETAIQALKSGAFDFLTKPIDLPALRSLVQNAVSLPERRTELTKKLIGDSNVIKELREAVSKLARNQAPVHISGESGVGKEMVARMIHAQGPRSSSPFIAVNCGAIPHELMESEFFGHKKGSFTGAVSDKEGLFSAANGGTLFLDEIAELPQSMQVKLLRVIQEKKVRPIGEQVEFPVNVRILSATHKNLAELVETGQFRQDLFFRINVIELKVPPLREHMEDIPILVEHILNRISNDYGNEKPFISEEAFTRLYSYEFPGNIRELENILERAIAMNNSAQLSADDFQLSTVARTTADVEVISDGQEIKLDSYLEEVERKIITETLEKTRWNKTKAARLLGISFRALRYRLEKLGLE